MTIITAGIAGDIYPSRQAYVPVVAMEESSMPNALDDAMMISYNWSKGMEERLKKIKETFSPAEIDEGIEFMLWSRAERERQEKAIATGQEIESSITKIDNEIIKLQEAFNDAIAAGYPETAIKLKNRIFDLKRAFLAVDKANAEIGEKID